MAQAFPTLIRIITEKKTYEVSLSLTGPVAEFTQVLDLEEGVVRIFGKAQEGFFGFTIAQNEGVIEMALERGNEVLCHIEGRKILLRKGEALEFISPAEIKPDNLERLFLGSTKKLCSEDIRSRSDLSEILPVIYLLGQQIPTPLHGDKREFYSTLEKLESEFLGGFEDIFVPLQKDFFHQGLEIDEMHPLARLRHFTQSIRSLFVREADAVEILPNLLKPFHAGKMTGVRLNSCLLDFEWSKRKVRKLEIVGLNDSIMRLKLPKEISSFRIKVNRRDRGSVIYANEKISIKKGIRYFLDKFEK